ncbi:MAG: UDP-N-acetylmuramate dehydrogenase [Bacteroidetes bacterium]|nr:UDP-N-acetylmuramate dehydrogenase [Bacteroidota bacterium]
MIFQKNQSLKPYNSFGLDVKAQYFCSFDSLDKLKVVLPECKSPLLILGGGSNVLLTQNFPGTVLKNEIKGIQIIEDSDDSVLVKVGAGVVWHDLVIWSIENKLAGIENLSLIPGSVGAAPMQNIGAYGVELKSVFEKLEALEIDSLQSRFFNKEECQFGYRYSIFKGKLKGKFIITSVYIRLQKTPTFNVSYGAIETELKNMGIEKLSLQSVSQAVINIRQSKLPNPKEIGNSGSFFKNPVITSKLFLRLQETHPTIVGYTISETETKVAAGWLIDQAGWKGYRKGDAGIHKNQALVLVNYGNAKGEELVKLSKEVQASVFQKFGISLEPEVNII